MADYFLSTSMSIPVSICCLGLLYCRTEKLIGQREGTLNLTDLSLLPLTPIMGSGLAPLQPQDVGDAAQRISYLALSDAEDRSSQSEIRSSTRLNNLAKSQPGTLRIFDAVGPEELTMLELLHRFSRFQGKANFRPVHIGYRNMEKILNVKSLGNLNRQFVSLLRSEQEDSKITVLGDPSQWETILGPSSKLLRYGAGGVRLCLLG